MGSILYVEGLQKRYGMKPALRNISLNLEEGHILGLMGPNGSGKTTFMKVVRKSGRYRKQKTCFFPARS